MIKPGRKQGRTRVVKPIAFRVSEVERATLSIAASRGGVSIGDFSRRAALAAAARRTRDDE